MSDSFAEIQQRLELLAQAWNRAERTLKACSVYLDEALARNEGGKENLEPAGKVGPITQATILELRYAGRRVVDAIKAGLLVRDDASKTRRAIDLIADAHYCCLRAQHDCIDSARYFVDRMVMGFEVEFSQYMLEQHGNGYSNLKDCLDKTATLVAKSRLHRDRRDDIYKEIEENYLGDMLAGARKLQSARGTLEAAKRDWSLLVEIREKQDESLEKQNEFYKRQNRFLWISATVGWVIGVVGCAIGVFAILEW